MAHSMQLVGSRSKKARGWVAAVLALLALATVGGTSSVGAVGCSSPAFCVGGYIRTVPGKTAGTTEQTCEGLCSPSKCANPGNVCVANLCELSCTSLQDCAPGQDCVAVTTDGTGGGGSGGTMTTICQDNGKAAIGVNCPFGNECTPASPPVAGGAQPACPDGSNCDYTQCATAGGMCTPDPIACAAITGKCPIGLCSGDGATACIVPGCAATDCKPLVCLSDAPAGSADEAAYCTLLDCHANTDCPGGYWCAKVPDPHQICGGPMPGANCGTTTDPCVDPSMDATNGTTFVKGPFCTLRNECRILRQCDPCATDLDCSLTAGRHCTTMASAKFCTQDCVTDADCVSGFECTTGECVPRAGSCTGSGKFCEMCHDDTECGTGFECLQFETGGERVCVNTSLPCMVDTDCPVAPSGLHGWCDIDATSPVCLIPMNSGSGELTCWPSNKDAACYLNTECISKHCTGADMVNMVPGTCD